MTKRCPPHPGRHRHTFGGGVVIWCSLCGSILLPGSATWVRRSDDWWDTQEDLRAARKEIEDGGAPVWEPVTRSEYEKIAKELGRLRSLVTEASTQPEFHIENDAGDGRAYADDVTGVIVEKP